MQQVYEEYKLKALNTLIIIAYGYMHFTLNGLFTRVTFDKLLTFDVPKPYLFRVLTPLLARLFHPFFSLSETFFIIEMGFVVLLFFSAQKLIKTYLNPKQAALFTLLFFVFLSLTYIINYRFVLLEPGTFFFPYDTPAVFFTVLGLYLCLTKQFTFLYPLIIIATLNRESSFLIILMLPALYMGTPVKWLKPFIFNSFLYGFIRAITYYIFFNHPGDFIEIQYHGFSFTHLSYNIALLVEKQMIFWFMSELAFLPLLWFALSNYIPKHLQRLRFVALFYIIGLFIVGNIMEGRIWGEAVAILYFPAMLGVCNWLKDKKVTDTSSLVGFAALEHYAVPFISFIALMIGLVCYHHKL